MIEAKRLQIVVCIKQVPDAKSVRFDKETGTLVRESAAAVINPYDLHALEAGFGLREKLGGEITVISMGPPQAMDALREAVSMGADNAVLLSDRAFAGADTLATTRVLAAAINRLPGFDLVLCGKLTVDGDTAQVGPGLACRLNIPSITCVNHIDLEKEAMLLTRTYDDGQDVVKVKLPVLLTVNKSLNTPRLPSFKGKMRAKSLQIPVWGCAELGLEPAETGLAGSPTRVIKTEVVSFEAKKEMLTGTVQEQVNALLERLKAHGMA